jgi:hypothetical protein
MFIIAGHALMMQCGQMLRKLAVQNNISVMVHLENIFKASL